MPKPLQNKTALVTGASKGLGKAIAMRLARDGAAVVVNYASDKAGAEDAVYQIVKGGGRAYALQGDISKVANIRKMFVDMEKAGFKFVDILINNAGVYPAGGLEDATEEIFDRIFDVNVKGLLFTTQEAVKRMPDGGRIVNISTDLVRVSVPAISVYSSSKGAVNVMTQDFAAALGSRRITVNAVSPGLTMTEGTSGMMTDSEWVVGYVKDTALGRMAEPRDIADVVAFLCTDDARWITAQIIEASGGYRLGAEK
ncbi:MAG: SDR family oxidoreductase [Alphaproteobacteria bacterium]|nr:SDR family oxidoreductase [Alphaproteobacteria bacterium]